MTETSGHGGPHVGDGETASAGRDRRIVFVIGSGRSGTSALAGALKLLGMHVPEPEVSADETNPKGFGESQWVVDFHNKLLRRSNILISDARPGAWFDAGRLATVETLREQLCTWLEEQFEAGHNEILIKDPRLVWFVSLWQAAAARLDAQTAYVIMLRPPHEVIGSKKKYYPSLQSELTRIAGWVNLMVHAERASRGAPRIFIHYSDLLADWTVPVYAAGERLQLSSVRSATAADIRKVHDYVDPSLHRVRDEQVEIDVPKRLMTLLEDTWHELNAIAAEGGDNPEASAAFDALRREYQSLYEEAEGIAQSTVMAVRRRTERQMAMEQAKQEPEERPRRGLLARITKG